MTVTHVGSIPPDASGQELVEALNANASVVHLVEDDRGTVYGVLVTADVEEALTTSRAKG